jgi:multiple sugar transport system substrate-binding protein
MKDRDQKAALASIASQYCDGKLARRDFLRRCARLGIGFSAAAGAGLLAPRPWPRLVPAVEAQPLSDSALQSWLRDVGGGFRGTSVRMVTETTPPSVVIKQLAQSEFTPLTGIDVQIELLPLERVLQRTSLDVANQTPLYDIYYLDQSWIARFADDTVDPREKYAADPDLAMPAYDWDDFLPSLVDGIAMYRGKMVGIPFDIPLFIMFYRRDVFEELDLSVPTTVDEYLAVAQRIQAAKAPDVYGTTGQMKAGHYSLNCEWTAWLWAHGGSVFDADGFFSGGDARGLDGLHYLTRLHENMPAYVDNWTWDGQSQSILQGLAGVALTWGELFPATDDPSMSLVPGLMEPAPPPRAKLLRAPADAGFGEIPNVGHQGGSALALSRNSQRQDAAWVFLQWATSRDVQTRASLAGGGASPTRASVFDDPRIRESATVQVGTTRHFDVIRQTINTAMGSEPALPSWPDISNGVIPTELGRYFKGQHASPEAAMMAIKSEADKLAAPYRS